MSSDDSSDVEDHDEDEIIRHFEAEGQLIINNLLPAKSSAKYELIYETFMKWKDNNSANLIEEKMLLVYFEELSKRLKPSTLWNQWSMLKTTLNLRHMINIDKYQLLKSFLKNKSKGYKPKKSQVLTWSQIKQFLHTSDDPIYLAVKVILIFGIFGALRTQEFINIDVTDVEDTGTQYIVAIRDTKNYYQRNFVIGAEFYNVVSKYISLRPDGMDTNRFFINYQKGKCTRQVIGKNKISEVPKTIALYLNIENAESYTGHCFRRTAATLLANSGANLAMVKQLGGWRSGAVAEGYIENSLANGRKIFEKITSSDHSSSVNKNCSIRTSTGTKSSAIPSTSREKPDDVPISTNNVNESPTFSPDDMNVPAPAKSNLKQPSRPALCEDSSKSLKRVPLQENQNLYPSAPSSKKKKYLEQNLSSSKREIENETLDEVSLTSSFVKFQNCEINHLTINNYSYKNRDEQMNK